MFFFGVMTFFCLDYLCAHVHAKNNFKDAGLDLKQIDYYIFIF